MACCSSQCERKHLCAHYINNPREVDGYESVENYYVSGSASFFLGRRIETWDCGSRGNWGMFSPISVELLKKKRDALNEAIAELESGQYGNV